MTTEALVGTLRNYADETTDIGKKAFAAAQDVKTFSQLIDTLKEAAGSGWANTWEILFGDFDEAKELWTGLSQAIGGFIDTQSDARNSVLQGWKDLGGRTELIESLKNTLKGIGTVIKPITEAFRDIFPPTTAEQLHNLTEGLLKFTEKLMLSDTASENLKNTFKGLFAILDICKRAIGAILGPVGSLLGKVTGLGGGVLGVTGSIGEWLVKLDEAIKKNDAFGKGIEEISDFVSGAVTAIKNFAESVREYLGLPTLDEAKESMKELFGTAEENIQVPGLELLHTILEKLKERAGQVKDAIVGLKDGISDAFSKIGGNTDVSKFAALIQALSIAAKKIGGGIFDALGNGINKIVTAVSNADFSGIIDLLNGISIGGIAIAITKFTNSLTKPFDEVGGLLDNVKGILDGVRGCFEAYQTQLKAGTLLKIASAIAILAASIVAISLIDSEKLSASLGAITVLFAELMASMSVFTKISGDVKGAVKSSTVMLAMSTSILILASALKKIGDLDGGQLAKGVAGVTALMAAMVGAVKLLNMSGGSSMKGATQMVLFAASIKILASVCTDLATLEWNGLVKGLTGVGVLLAEVSLFMNTAKFSGKSLTTAAGIVILASAIKILASACKDLGSLDFGQLVKGLGSIGVLLAEITVFTKLTGNAKGLVSTGIAMIGIGAAMKIFASAMGDFGNLDWNQIAKGLVAMGGALAEVAIAMKVMPKNTISVGIGLIAVGAALEIVANALGKMGGMTWEEIAKGLVTMGGALAELAIGLNVMNGTLPGSAAMLVAAGALAVLTPVLLALGSMSWESIAKGLVTIAGAFTVIGVAGLVLTPLVPTILALAGAFALIGVGTAAIGAGLLAAGAGLSAIAVGITALATSLGAGVTVIVAGLSTIITGIAALIPAIAEKLGEAIIAFCGVIAQGAPAIGEAVKAVVLTLVDVLVECVPAIADGALALLSGVLASLANYTPEIVDSIMLFLINLLNGIAERLPELIQAAVNVIAAFFSGIIDALAGLDTSVLVKTIAGIGLLSGIMVALGAVAALIPSAMIGVLGMGALIAELAIVLAAVGALAQIPGLSWLIGEGGKLLEQIGTAIGGFVGGIVGGFMSGISSQFPQIGSDLAAFMTNVQPFIDGASSISPAMFSGVQALTDAILLLTKAELVQGIASWFTGSSSLSDFADELVPFGESMAEFSNAISGMDADLVSKAATAGKALAEMATTLPNSGGVVGFFAGENDMDKFGEQLVPFGKAMKDYSLAVKGMDVGAVSNSASAGKALVELSNTIPNCGGLVSFFTGDNSIADFGDQLVLFGNGLAAYSASIEGINMSKLSGAITQVEKLVALADTVKNMDQYAFVNFTNALVLLANTSIQNFTDAFYNSGATVSTAVIYMLNSAGTTIRQNQTIVNVAMAELMLAMAATVKAHTTSMNTAVVQMMVGFSTTIRSNGASVRTAMQSVMLVVVAEVNNYKDQFNEAGRNVSQGFINGIRSKLSGASQAGRDLGLAALNAAKKALDSHSPSREFIELGKNIGEGMTIGINNAIVPVSSAAAKMSDEAIKVAQKGLDSFKDWAEERKYYSELSLKEELAGWETLQKKYREGSEERKQIDREVYRVQNELVTATYQYSMNWIEEQKSYNKLTLAEELAAYKRVQSRYAKGTELRKKLDLQVYQLEKEISDAQKQYISDVQSVQSEANQKRLDLEEEYADKVKSINAQLASDIQAENDKYENALKSREDSLYKSYGLFDAVKERDEVSGDTLMKNLEGQVKEFGEWQDILESLAGRGLDSDLIEELQDMGPDAIAQIKALNNMSDSELEKYADLWKVKHAMAREQAVGELEGLREETQQNIAKLREEADQELTEYRDLWQEKMNQVTEDANAQLEQLRRSFEEKIGLIKNNTDLADLQFDNMELEVSALDLHYLNANVEAVKLLDEIRVISRPHGLDRVFPVTKLEIPLDSPENTQFTLGDTVQTSLTSVNNQISAAILEKIDGLPKAHNILKEAKENATQIMTAATTGYITITRDEYGSDTLYISNIRDYTKADKLWKWNMNGLGYSKDYGKTFGFAITMDGSIVADYITTGVLNADVIRAGTLKDYGGNFSLDFETGKLTMKKGSIDIGGGNFTVDEEGNLTARRGTFAGTLAAAKGTFSGTLVGVDGNFKGVVQASDFLDRAGNSMMDDERFKSKYLSVYGLTVTNGVRTTFAVDSSGSVTIDGKVTLSAGSTINWASVTNQNLTSNPAYSLASTANANAATAKSAADDAYDEASAAWSRANKAYQDRCTDQNVFDVLTSGGTKFGIFSDSYSGRLYINADYIRSGTINADYIDLSCDYGGFCKGHGSDGQHTTYGAMMYGSNGPGWEPYIIVTNAGARISGTGADLVVSGGITMSEEPSYGSDLRIKNSIDYDLASYEAFFLALKPSTFKYNKGTSGRKHFGFIAQDVEQAMLDTGLTSDQLAALVKDPVKEILSDGITDYRYSIRYGELIALNTHMIQKLYQMVEELLQQKEG